MTGSPKAAGSSRAAERASHAWPRRLRGGHCQGRRDDPFRHDCKWTMTVCAADAAANRPRPEVLFDCTERPLDAGSGAVRVVEGSCKLDALVELRDRDFSVDFRHLEGVLGGQRGRGPVTVPALSREETASPIPECSKMI